MNYTTPATSKTPCFIIYLLDVSASMQRDLEGAPRIKHVSDSLRSIVKRMVQRSTKGAVVSPRYTVAMAAYSADVTDILGGFKPINEVAQKGSPLLTETQSTTDTAAAFMWARDLLNSVLPTLNGMPAPMVCHITDGEYNGADPEPIAREIMNMSNSDGNVLVENVYVAKDFTLESISDPYTWKGVLKEEDLTNDVYVRKLFRMSSPFPASYAGVIQEEGYHLQAGARMLIPAINQGLVELGFAMSGATPVEQIRAPQ